MGFNPVAIAAAGDAGDPVLMVKIPGDGVADAGFERDLRLPSELALDARAVDSVAAIVSRTVADVGDQAGVRLVR